MYIYIYMPIYIERDIEIIYIYTYLYIYIVYITELILPLIAGDFSTLRGLRVRITRPPPSGLSSLAPTAPPRTRTIVLFVDYVFCSYYYH